MLNAATLTAIPISVMPRGKFIYKVQECCCEIRDMRCLLRKE